MFSVVFSPAALYLLNGSLLVLLFGLAVRYTAIFTLNLDRAQLRIPHVFADVSSTLGHVGFAMFRRVHLPLLLPALFYTFLIVTIEVFEGDAFDADDSSVWVGYVGG